MAAVIRRSSLASTTSKRSRTAPSRRTTKRSQRPSSSADSDETTTIAVPLSASARIEAVDLGLRADVDADGRLVEQQHARLPPERARQHHLLLVAAAERPDRRVDRRRRDREALDRLGGEALLGRRVDQQPAERAQVGERHVLAHAEVEQQPVALAVLGDESDAGLQRLARRARADRSALEHDAPSGDREAAVAGAEHLAAAGADEPAEADDLPGGDGEADVAHDELAGALRMGDAEPLDGEHLVALGRQLGARRVEVGQAPPDHRADDPLRVELRACDLVDDSAVAQHREAVAQLGDLVEPVADEDGRQPVLAQVADDVEEAVGLLARQRGGRLVEDQHRRVAVERAGDHHELLVTGAELADGRARVERQPPLVQEARRAALRVADVGEHAPAVGAEADVLADGERVDHARLLRDDRDPAHARVLRRVQRDGAAADQHAPVVAAARGAGRRGSSTASTCRRRSRRRGRGPRHGARARSRRRAR